MVVIGKVEELSEIKVLKEGTSKKGRAWTLYGALWRHRLLENRAGSSFEGRQGGC
jgi:hypothetical protein